MGDTPEYNIWTPKFTGDAPPNWSKNMSAKTVIGGETLPAPVPAWVKGKTYKVPPEALSAPFCYHTWAAQGRANRDKLPSGVAEALGPERDWAEEIVAEIKRFQSGDNAAVLANAIAVIKSRCRPINDTVTEGVGQ